MRFWDTSAIVPLLTTEAQSEMMREVLADDPRIATAAIAPLEISSALWRRRHRREIGIAAQYEAEVLFASLTRRWREVLHTAEVTEVALRLVTRHPMKSLDALQLASAIVLAPEPDILPFVTLDKGLKAAARSEGFPVLP
ncbi:MAG TPA: type II toxin-antitoxin system VapC family toxin [Thermoanaerobaculia bacterium]|jgi:predicted nucleic acid-binding protein